MWRVRPAGGAGLRGRGRKGVWCPGRGRLHLPSQGPCQRALEPSAGLGEEETERVSECRNEVLPTSLCLPLRFGPGSPPPALSVGFGSFQSCFRRCVTTSFQNIRRL